MRKKQINKNLNLAFIFVFFVVCLIIISFIARFVFLIKESRFDSTHSFIAAFVSKNGIELVNFSPQNNSLYILDVGKTEKVENISQNLSIPLNGIVYTDKNNFSNKNISGELLKSSFPFGDRLSGMTRLDALRLFLFLKSVPSTSVYDRVLGSNPSDGLLSSYITLTFLNPTVSKENESIQVINGTDTYGLGTRLANLITNIGGNVILVTTAVNNSNNSKITYSGKSSYTVKMLSDYLGIPAVNTGRRGIADVIITVGEDLAHTNKF